MKKSLLTFVALLCYMMTATVFTACSKDDDKSDSGGATQKQVVRIYYEFTLGQAYLDYYDVYCTFTDVDGVVQKVVCTAKAYKYDEVVDYDKAPNSYEFSVVAVPKNPLPDIDPEGVYDVSHSYAVDVCVRNSSDLAKITKTIMKGSNSGNNRQSKGSALKGVIEEGQRDIVKKLTGTK